MRATGEPTRLALVGSRLLRCFFRGRCGITVSSSRRAALPGRDKRFAFFPPRTPPFFGARGEQTFMVVSPLNYSACVQAVAQPSLAAYCSALLHLRKIFFAHPAAVVCRFVPMPPARSRATRSQPVGNKRYWEFLVNHCNKRAADAIKPCCLCP